MRQGLERLATEQPNTKVSMSIAELAATCAQYEREGKDELLTRREAADMVGVSPQTIYRWEQQQMLTSERLGGIVRYHKSQLKKFIKNGHKH